MGGMVQPRVGVESRVLDTPKMTETQGDEETRVGGVVSVTPDVLSDPQPPCVSPRDRERLSHWSVLLRIE